MGERSTVRLMAQKKMRVRGGVDTERWKARNAEVSEC